MPLSGSSQNTFSEIYLSLFWLMAAAIFIANFALYTIQAGSWSAVVMDLWNAYIRTAQTGWDANIVVAMRLMRLASGGALAQREAQRMVTEKTFAIAEAQIAAASKIMMGGGISAATNSASAVYRRKIRANRRRLGAS